MKYFKSSAAQENESAPIDQPAMSAPEPHARTGKSDEILSPEFWDKLADKVPENPEKGKVEYNYPE